MRLEEKFFTKARKLIEKIVFSISMIMHNLGRFSFRNFPKNSQPCALSFILKLNSKDMDRNTFLKLFV